MKLKRILAAVLCVSILSAMPVNYVYAKSEIELNSSVIYSNIEDMALCFLDGLNIDSEFVEQESVTRGQAISLMMSVSYDEKIVDSDETFFSDVTDDYEYKNSIYFACRKEIVSKGSKFRPDDNITYAELMTMAVRTLGYGLVAEQYGTYPNGYILCGENIGLSKGVKKSAYDIIDGKDVLVILYNMLNTNLMITKFSDGGISYDEGDDITILTKRYGLKKIDGKITSTPYSDLIEKSSCLENQIKINGKPFYYEGESFEMLGMHVLAYYDEHDNVKIICPVKNQILKIDEVIRYKDHVIEYEFENRVKTAKLDESFSYIYNGQAYPDYDEETDFTNIYGYLKLMDNDLDGDYDICNVTEVEYLNITSIDKVNEKIYGKGVEINNIDMYDSLIKLHSGNVDGEEIGIGDLVVGELLAVMLSKDKKIGKAVVIDKEITGRINGINSEYLEIDGIEYLKSNYLKKYYNPKVGENCTVELGLLNDLVTINIHESSEYRYGYLIKVFMDEEDMVYMKIFEESGEMAKYSFSESFYLDGKRVKTADKWDKGFTPLTDFSNVSQRQLIKYKVTDGMITGVDTVEDATEMFGNVDDNKNSLLRYYDQIDTVFKADGMNSFLRFNITGNTTILTVPEKTETEIVDKDFALTKMSSLTKDAAYKVDAYDIDANGIPRIVLLYQKPEDSGTQLGVVDDVQVVWDDDRGICAMVGVWNKNKYLTYYILQDEYDEFLYKSTGKQLGAGDVIFYDDKDSVIRYLDVYFDAETKEITPTAAGFVTYDKGYKDRMSCYMSSLYRVFDKKYVITWTKDKKGNWDYSIPNLRTIPLVSEPTIVCVEDGKTYLIPIEEIRDYYSTANSADEVFLLQQYWYGTCIVIIRD